MAPRRATTRLGVYLDKNRLVGAVIAFRPIKVRVVGL